MTLKLAKNGPIVIMTGGSYTIRDGETETVVEKPTLALCRCGAAPKKPMCDGTHRSWDFEGDLLEIELG